MRIIDYTLSDVFTHDPNNRWVLKAKLVPWEIAEEKYSHMFRKNGRKALGVLLIQQDMKCSDEDVVQHIKENPHLQYFIGTDIWNRVLACLTKSVIVLALVVINLRELAKSFLRRFLRILHFASELPAVVA